MAIYFQLQSSSKAAANIGRGVESILWLSVALSLACVLIVNATFMREGFAVVDRTLVHTKWWFLVRLQKEIDLEQVSSIEVVANTAKSGLSNAQNAVLKEFGHLHLRFGRLERVGRVVEESVHMAHGYSLAILNLVAEKIHQKSISLISRSTEKINLVLSQRTQTEPMHDPKTSIALDSKTGLHHNAVKSLVLSLGLFALGGVVTYIDVNPTAAMLAKQGHTSGEILPLCYALISIAVVYFGLFCWYFQKSTSSSQLVLGSSYLQTFGKRSSRNLLQIHKSEISCAYIDHFTSAFGNGYELILMDHAMNPTILASAKVGEKLEDVARSINHWLKTSSLAPAP
jgi:hypothetical protein